MSNLRGEGEAEPPAEPESPPRPVLVDDITIEVFVNQTSETHSMPLEEYLVGVVAAEMPASFHAEALKAQAVLARTYAVAKMREFGGAGTRISDDADISDDPDYDQAWISNERMRDRWGWVSYWTNLGKIEDAVKSTAGLVMVYDDQLIEAVYHSTSGGRTENAACVWGSDHSYLQSVESPHESHSPYTKNSHYFSWDELSQLLGLDHAEVISSSKDPGVPVVKVKEKTRSGRVDTAVICGQDFCARNLRNMLDLPSTWWEAEMGSDGVTFNTRGFGHGVGLSQYGADGMAQQGYSFDEILNHYYRGASLRPLSKLEEFSD